MITEYTRRVVAIESRVEDQGLSVVGIKSLPTDAERIGLQVVQIVEMNSVGVSTNALLRTNAFSLIDVGV